MAQATGQRIRALAFNALTAATDDDWWLPLFIRSRLSEAVVDAVEQEIRADERARILEAADRLREPHRRPGQPGDTEYAVPLSLLRAALDLPA